MRNPGREVTHPPGQMAEAHGRPEGSLDQRGTIGLMPDLEAVGDLLEFDLELAGRHQGPILIIASPPENTRRENDQVQTSSGRDMHRSRSRMRQRRHPEWTQPDRTAATGGAERGRNIPRNRRGLAGRRLSGTVPDERHRYAIRRPGDDRRSGRRRRRRLGARYRQDRR